MTGACWAKAIGDSGNFAIDRGEGRASAAISPCSPARAAWRPTARDMLYFHGGASLAGSGRAGAAVRLNQGHCSRTWRPRRSCLSYKNGAKKITTRLPVIELAVNSATTCSRQGASSKS